MVGDAKHEPGAAFAGPRHNMRRRSDESSDLYGSECRNFVARA